MNDTDLHKLVSELSTAQVHLPRHQRVLRAKLLHAFAATQQTERRSFPSTLRLIHKGELYSMKTYLTAGASVLALSVLAVSVISLSGGQSASAAQLVQTATTQTQHMSADKVSQIENQFHQKLQQRLAEAKQAKDLRILPTSELNSWSQKVAGQTKLVKQDPSVKTYLTYTDASGHRIVIALDASDKPLYVFDFDTMAQDYIKGRTVHFNPNSNG